MKNLSNLCLFSCFVSLCLWSQFLWANDNAKADAILNKLEEGSVVTNEHIQAYIDEAEALIGAKDEARKMRLLKAKCWVHDFRIPEENEKAINFANYWLPKIKLEQYPVTKIDLLLCKSWFEENKGEQQLALSGYQTALKLALETNSTRVVADAYSLLGELQSYQGNFTGALTHLIKAQQLYEELNLPYWQLYNLTGIATSYRRFGDPQRAIHYYQKITKIYQENNNQEQIAFVRRDIAFALEELERYQEAIEKHQQNYLYYKALNKEIDQAIAGVEIAGALIQINKIAQAKVYLDEAQQTVTSDSPEIYSYLQFYLAQIAISESQLNKAIEHIDQALAGFLANKNERFYLKSLLLQSQIFAQQAQWQAAYKAQEKYIERHEIQDKQQISLYTAEMRHKFDLDQVESENKKLLEYKQLKENEKRILERNKQLQLIIMIMALIIIMYLCYSVYKQQKKAKGLEALALTDHLTQLPNRRHMYKWGEYQFLKAKKYHTPLAIILFDADHFKKINDEQGHEEGDKVLVRLAQLSAKLMRKQDKVGRIGGEEFLVVLNNTSKDQALIIAQRLVEAVNKESENFSHYHHKLSISAGVAFIDDTHKLKDFNSLVKQADEALYQAKSAGRNCAKLSNAE